MKARINQKLLQSITPADRAYEVRDDQLPGFILRVQPTGSKTYYVEWRRGKRSRVGNASVLLPAQARERARELLNASFGGRDPVAELKQRQPMTLDRFIKEHYADWALKNLARGEAVVRRIEQNFGAFSDTPLKDIAVQSIDRWRSEKIGRSIKPTTINRDVAGFRAMLSKAVEWGYLTANPLAGLKPLKARDGNIVRYLSADEYQRLMTALKNRDEAFRSKRKSANAWRRKRGIKPLPIVLKGEYADHLTPMTILCLNTGLRRGELFALEWSDIDFERSQLTVRGNKAKSGKRRILPLNDDATHALTNWRDFRDEDKPTGLVFPGPNGGQLTTIKTAWLAICRAAEITDLRWHDLRHTFASHLAMKGEDLNTIRELLGHSDYKTTLIYAHLTPEHNLRAVSRLFS